MANAPGGEAYRIHVWIRQIGIGNTIGDGDEDPGNGRITLTPPARLE